MAGNKVSRPAAIFCRGCDYDLAGLDHNRCPECGRAFDPDDAKTFFALPRQQRRRRWVVRGSYVVAALVVGFVVVNLGLSQISYRTETWECYKCFVSISSRQWAVFGITLVDEQNCDYWDSPNVRAKQQACLHPWVGGWAKERAYGLLGGTLRASGEFPRGARWAKLLVVNWEQAMPELIAELSRLQDQQQLDNWAWAVQEGTGHDFGIVYDDKKPGPVVPPGTIDRILEWWKAKEAAAAQAG
jgi:hypothetical protein